jgi:hypothetical protein
MFLLVENGMKYDVRRILSQYRERRMEKQETGSSIVSASS